MPFHEIREVNFSTLFNSAWDRRQKLEHLRESGKRRIVRTRVPVVRDSGGTEIDVWA